MSWAQRMLDNCNDPAMTAWLEHAMADREERLDRADYMDERDADEQRRAEEFALREEAGWPVERLSPRDYDEELPF